MRAVFLPGQTCARRFRMVVAWEPDNGLKNYRQHPCAAPEVGILLR